MLGDVAWVVTREQMIDEQLVRPDGRRRRSRSRLGDVALVAHEPVSFYDPADSGPFELVCRHGSLTSAEVYVPLVRAVMPNSMTPMTETVSDSMMTSTR